LCRGGAVVRLHEKGGKEHEVPCHHVFDISTRVSIPKYRTVSFCIVMLCIGGFLAAAALIVQSAPDETTLNLPPPAIVALQGRTLCAESQ